MSTRSARRWGRYGPRVTALGLQLRRGWSLVVAVTIVLEAGCGEGASPTTAAVQRVDGCLRLGRGAERTQVRVQASLTLRGAVIGAGRDGVVLANQSDRDLCSWLPLARALTHAGFRVLLFDYSGAEPQADVAAAAREPRREGARSVALIGASKGARAVLVAASLRAAGAAAVVSLSAESTGRTGPPRIAPFVRRLRVPVLFVAARHDPWTADGADTRELYSAARLAERRLVELPGDAHGVDLLAGPRGKRVRDVIVAFLHRHAQIR